MTDPQHLWSGDWSKESAAARERAVRERALAEPADSSPPPAEQPTGDGAARGMRAAIAAGWRSGLRRARSALARSGLSPARLITIAVIAALAGGAITVGAEGLSATGSGRAWLGVALATNPAGSGALIEYVVPGGPADRAGIQPGDVIGAVNGHPVGAPAGLVDDIAGMSAGDEVALQVIRLGQQRVIDATLVTPERRPVTFSAPWALFALLALPVFALWYGDRQRNRAHEEAAFVTPALAASVLPARPGWRRHAPMLAFALSLGVLIIALADPRESHAVAVQRSSIMLAGDVSGSMAATDVLPTRLLAARRAAARFIAEVPAHIGIGVMTFNQEPQVLQTPTTDRAADRRALTGWRAHGGTAIGTAIVGALGVLDNGRARTRPPAAIVLVSDGGSASGVSALAAARRARDAHIPLYTVAFGTAAGTITVKGVTQRVPPDPTLLAAIARISRGRAFTARDAAALSAAYRTLGVKLGHHQAQRHLAAGFAGAALVLLLAGGAMSMAWFGRPL